MTPSRRTFLLGSISLTACGTAAALGWAATPPAGATGDTTIAFYLKTEDWSAARGHPARTHCRCSACVSHGQSKIFSSLAAANDPALRAHPGCLCEPAEIELASTTYSELFAVTTTVDRRNAATAAILAGPTTTTPSDPTTTTPSDPTTTTPSDPTTTTPSDPTTTAPSDPTTTTPSDPTTTTPSDPTTTTPSDPTTTTPSDPTTTTPSDPTTTTPSDPTTTTPSDPTTTTPSDPTTTTPSDPTTTTPSDPTTTTPSDPTTTTPSDPTTTTPSDPMKTRTTATSGPTLSAGAAATPAANGFRSGVANAGATHAGMAVAGVASSGPGVVGATRRGQPRTVRPTTRPSTRPSPTGGSPELKLASAPAHSRSLPVERIGLPFAGAVTALALLLVWRRRGEREAAEVAVPPVPDEPIS